MGNFELFKSETIFSSFVDVAITAEKILSIDTSACVFNCRKAMEVAIKWMYSVDRDLDEPIDDNLANLLRTPEFIEIVGDDLLQRLHLIRKTGNIAAHATRQISKEQALLCLENLFNFFDFIGYCYSQNYEQKKFDPKLSLSAQEPKEKIVIKEVPSKESLEAELKLQDLLKENAALREELSARREENKSSYVANPLNISEYETRKIYIDTMLMDAGWVEGKNWINEYEIRGMPNKSGVGYADYVLLSDTGAILAVVEAKRTCKDVSVGRQQAKLYADLIEKSQGFRPVVFLTNGFETRIVDGQYPERPCSVIYSKRDLERLFNLRKRKTDLKNVKIDKSIAGRYYQEEAIKKVCESFGENNRRKALLVMATGSGKTRTVIGLVKVLLEEGWASNILFLADRTSLVTQAQRSFVNLMPNLSLCNLTEERDINARRAAKCIFSTYQTMMNCIDSVRDGDDKKLFTCGHFDIVICDEAHRSIYNKFRDIFNYFDAPLVGLTATPKDEIDKNTYEVFNLENNQPTYAYELAQAVADGYLVDFISIETALKFLENGISYDDLSEEDKQSFEETFANIEDLPDSISSSALNEWVFNKDTIRKVLDTLMNKGLKVEYGNKIGKTIIFAKNHKHAEKILEVFNDEYPKLNGYAVVIDNFINYAQKAIDEFSEPQKLPQIAISVDMLDTGIDVPEVLNLVFFKKVMSKSKFWQMIGRGTRLCEGLIDGADKNKFYIFDFCGNFQFFRMNTRGEPSSRMLSLQGALFSLQFEMCFKLQDINYQTEELISFRKKLVEYLVKKVQELNRKNFSVQQHLKYVELYSSAANYENLAYENTLEVREELAPLIEPDDDEASALRFDALLYGIELAKLEGKKFAKARHDLLCKVKAISKLANIPEIRTKSDLITTILETDYLERSDVGEFEHIRESLRDLMKYIKKDNTTYDTDFTDLILSQDWNESELGNDDLRDYKTKAAYYVREHQDDAVIGKLKHNIPLTAADVEALEKILWSEVGSEEEYKSAYGEKSLGQFVREIVGLDMTAAKEAFSEFLDETRLDSRQIYFVNQIVEFIVHNGMMTDLSVLQGAPFTNMGSISDVFTDPTVWLGVKKAIARINANAQAA